MPRSSLQRPLVDVAQIELGAIVEVLIESSLNLPQAGHSGPNRQAPAVPDVVRVDLPRWGRPRADEAHVALEDVEELGKLVQGPLPQRSTDRVTRGSFSILNAAPRVSLRSATSAYRSSASQPSCGTCRS